MNIKYHDNDKDKQGRTQPMYTALNFPYSQTEVSTLILGINANGSRSPLHSVAGNLHVNRVL